MGGLSSIAQSISAALQNPSIRGALRDELSDPSNVTGLDLQSCADGSIAQRVFDDASRRGFQGATSLCEMVVKRHGLTLYMDRDRLARWSPSVAPIVTAIEHPENALPSRLLGYRSPSRTIAFSNDSSYVGPVLLVLPHAQARRVANRGPELMDVKTRRYPAKTQTAGEPKR